MNEQSSDSFGNLPNASANFGNVPQGAEGFGTIPNDAESFRTLRNAEERTEQHTLTVRDVARLFEQAGVPRTERSIVNWCQPNHQGVARLGAFFDTNERKYFITSQSVSAAIGEEKAKQAASGTLADNSDNETRKPSEPAPAPAEDPEVDTMRNKLRDLEITNRVKDQVISMMEKERDRLMDERETRVRELMTQSHRIGQLETQLLQLGAPNEDFSEQRISDRH